MPKCLLCGDECDTFEEESLEDHGFRDRSNWVLETITLSTCCEYDVTEEEDHD